MIKRISAWLLCLCLVFAAAGAHAQGTSDALYGSVGVRLLDTIVSESSQSLKEDPYLSMYVEYEEPNDEGIVAARVHLRHENGNGQSDNPAASDIIIALECTDGLELYQSQDFYLLEQDLPCGQEVSFPIQIRYVKYERATNDIPEPELTIKVTSSNLGGCEYSCLFDATVEARALVLGWDTEGNTPDAIQNDVDMMTELFSRSYYNKRPVEVTSVYNHEDFWEIFGELSDWEIDGNDVTYIYLNAHGVMVNWAPSPAFLAFAPGASAILNGVTYTDKNIILYNQIFPYLAQLPGNVVFLIDSCYSGYAISRADTAGVDQEHFSLLTANVEDQPAGAYENPFAAYGWFTKDLYDFANTSENTTVSEAYAYLTERGSHWYTWGKLQPQLLGNDEEYIFTYAEFLAYIGK